MVSIAKPKQPIVIIIESSQPIQLVVEPIHVKNPYFSITQPILVSSHSTYNLKQINMF